MKKIISFVVFGEDPRYFANIPYILLAYPEIYRGFIVRFYVHKDSVHTKGYQLLQKVAEITNSVEVEIIQDESIGTKLTIWRMKPLWESDVEIFLCRDTDSIINCPERKATEAFFKSSLGAHGIRSYALHSVPYLAGLCGFKPSIIIDKVKQKAKTFNEYVDWGHDNIDYCKEWIWGCDQSLLRDFFNTVKLYSETLDCPQQCAPVNIPGYLSGHKLTEDGYAKIALPECNIPLLKYSNTIAGRYAGHAINAKKSEVFAMLDMIDNDISKVIRGSYE